jgi:hypothetical protein
MLAGKVLPVLQKATYQHVFKQLYLIDLQLLLLMQE